MGKIAMTIKRGSRVPLRPSRSVIPPITGQRIAVLTHICDFLVGAVKYDKQAQLPSCICKLDLRQPIC